MVSAINQNRAAVLVVLCQVFFVLVVGISVVQADGEEPFAGVIEKIASDTITIRVTDKEFSERKIGDKVTLVITEDTMITDKSRNTISFDKLSAGLSVEIKPRTLPDKHVEATMIKVK